MQTLSQKVWDRHVVHAAPDEPDVLFIDLHLVHEVTSPQAFDGLRLAKRGVRRPDLTLATMDHNVPTTSLLEPVKDPISKKQMDVLQANCDEFGIRLYPMGHAKQGIVHIIGPEQGLTQPGMTIVCGDSHTSTHGAFGALAFGIGTSEVEHVLATQTLRAQHSKNMRVTVNGKLPEGVTAKDIALAVIAKMMSLAVTPGCTEPSTVTLIHRGSAWGSVWVARTCSTSLVPMPKASAPNAPWVAVWLSPQTMVIPGIVRPCSVAATHGAASCT